MGIKIEGTFVQVSVQADLHWRWAHMLSAGTIIKTGLQPFTEEEASCQTDLLGYANLSEPIQFAVLIPGRSPITITPAKII